MSKFWFDNDEQKKCIIPFVPTKEEVACCYRLGNDNIKFKQEVLDDSKALSNIQRSLFTMVMLSREQGEIVLDEEDCKFLYDIATKQIQLDFTKMGG